MHENCTITLGTHCINFSYYLNVTTHTHTHTHTHIVINRVLTPPSIGDHYQISASTFRKEVTTEVANDSEMRFEFFSLGRGLVGCDFLY